MKKEEKEFYQSFVNLNKYYSKSPSKGFAPNNSMPSGLIQENDTSYPEIAALARKVRQNWILGALTATLAILKFIKIPILHFETEDSYGIDLIKEIIGRRKKERAITLVINGEYPYPDWHKKKLRNKVENMLYEVYRLGDPKAIHYESPCILVTSPEELMTIMLNQYLRFNSNPSLSEGMTPEINITLEALNIHLKRDEKMYDILNSCYQLQETQLSLKEVKKKYKLETEGFDLLKEEGINEVFKYIFADNNTHTYDEKIKIYEEEIIALKFYNTPEGRRINIEPLYESLYTVGFNTRTRNALLSANIRYVGQLVNCDPEKIIKYRNMGKKTVDELKEFVAKKGYSFNLPLTLEMKKRMKRN